MSWPLKTCIDRLVIFEKAAWNSQTSISCDAHPVYYHAQESVPYWTNRIGPGSLNDDGDEFDLPSQVILARLVLGHVTSGYSGDYEDLLADFIPYFVEYISDRPRLVTNTTAGTSPNPVSELVEARIARWTGFTAFMNSGLSVVQAGTEFSIILEFNDTVRE